MDFRKIMHKDAIKFPVANWEAFIGLRQFVNFKPLSYCFEETIGFDVKALFTSRLWRLAILRWRFLAGNGMERGFENQKYVEVGFFSPIVNNLYYVKHFFNTQILWILYSYINSKLIINWKSQFFKNVLRKLEGSLEKT